MLQGTITRITSDKVMSEIVLDIPAGELVAVITAASTKSMKLKRGKVVRALVKATNISLGECDCGQP